MTAIALLIALVLHTRVRVADAICAVLMPNGEAHMAYIVPTFGGMEVWQADASQAYSFPGEAVLMRCNTPDLQNVRIA